MILSAVQIGIRWVSAHKAIAIGAIIVVGFALGLALRQLGEGPARPATVPQLIHALQRQETPLHLIWQDVWVCLPGWMTSRCGMIAPRSAAAVRRGAAAELGALGKTATPALPFLTQALQDPDQDVRLAALQALRDLGPVARSTTSALIALLDDPAYNPVAGFPSLRTAVAGTLAGVALADPQVIKVFLRDASNHPDPEYRAGVIQLLGGLLTPPPNVMAALLDWLRSDQPLSRDAAVAAFGQIGPGAAPSVPALLEVYEKLDAQKGSQAASDPQPIPAPRQWGLSNPVPTPPNPAPPATSQTVTMVSVAPGQPIPSSIISQLPSSLSVRYGFNPGLDGWQCQLRILETLGKIGPAARAGLPLLIRESTNHAKPFFPQAAFAKWQIDQDAPAACVILAEQLRKSVPVQNRCSVIDLLSQIGPEAIPTLSVTLDQAETTVRWAGINALGQFGPAAASVVPRLEELLRADPKMAVRFVAESALKRIAPDRTWKANIVLAPPQSHKEGAAAVDR